MNARRPDNTPPHRYNAALAGEIETRWQRVWADAGTYRVANPGETLPTGETFDATKPKFYCLDMFPYPSGSGLHVGHPEGYTATDIVSRYKRMNGFNVLHPMGFDAFGLPAEQHAINTGEHPAGFTRQTIDTFRRQLQRFGFGYDWSREFATIDEDYYRWTQWIFLQIYNAWFDHDAGRARPIAELIEAAESDPDHAWHAMSPGERRRFVDDHRLAYLGEQTVNWCPRLGTVLANEEVIDGRSERGGHPVLRKPLKQWLFRITAYADRLLSGLDELDWPESTKAQQREWIGRSQGAEIDFELRGVDGLAVDPSLRVYTTRPDTVFGATYMVVAPEHPLVEEVLRSPRDATPNDKLRAYVEWAANRSDLERQESKDKTGVYTGVDAVNPATGERVPVWTSDYVLMGYGFGAIMAVPAHDDRDLEFAEKFGLEVRQVVYPAPLYPMWWLGTHAELKTLGDSAHWRNTVEDFMGLVATNGVAEADYPRALEQVVTNRRPGEQPGEPSLSGRGAVRMIWTETIDEMKIGSPEEFLDRMRSPERVRRLGEAFTEPGRAINSSNADVDLNGLNTQDAKARTIDWLERTGLGRRRTNYKLRDWLFSRQRYWGEPFPIVFDEHGQHHAVGEHTLPVALPEMTDYAPAESDDPQPPLGKATGWVRLTAGEAGVDALPADAPVTRETNTMPGWAGSCWYHLRYADRDNAENAIGPDADAYWLGENGVDLYIGGAEHAVLHLLYARFWHMVLYDLGHVRSSEPYRKLFHQGLITSFAYQRKDKSLVPVDQVIERDGGFVDADGEPVFQTTAKMSKSLKNVVNPDEIIDRFGADTFRLYEMYMGPLEASKPWNTDDTIGLFRFLQRAWRTLVREDTGELSLADTADAGTEKLLHRTIAKVGPDVERLSFNTAIAAMIEFVNAAGKTGLTHDQADRFARILAPFAPHLGEELWSRLGHDPASGDSIAVAPWPNFDDAMLVDDEAEIPVQILGKLRARVTVPSDADQKAIEAAAMADPRVQELLKGKTVRKVIVVPGRLVNIVAN
ncbi:MAG: class I tRNA ligase family protein [Planctomycetota bacterium]